MSSTWVARLICLRAIIRGYKDDDPLSGLKSIFYKNIHEKINLTQKICKECPVDFAQNQRGSPCNFLCQIDFHVKIFL